jgi:hypothetical protein
LLLALRAIYCGTSFGRVLERGTGAKYVSATALKRCLVPTAFPQNVDNLLGEYKRAVRLRDSGKMMGVEDQLRMEVFA